MATVRLCLLGALLASPLAHAGYAPLGTPERWEFTEATPAYRPDNGEELGKFQPGVTVKVLDADLPGGTWLVEYARYGAAPIRALIPIPDLSKTEPHAYAGVREQIESFPLLKKQLEADNPWSVSLPELKERLFRGDAVLRDGTEENPTDLASDKPRLDGFAWDQMPIEVRLKKTPAGARRIIINIWNKGDSQSVVDPRRAYPIIRENLEEIEQAFGTGQSFGLNAREAHNNGIVAIRDNTECFYLPNDIEARLRYNDGEYLILELCSFSKAETDKLPATSASNLSAHVKTSEDGERYIDDIPMISQGDKGYCVAATLARVLSYYGYPVDMYAVADLAETERYGTSLDNVTESIRRVSGTTPLPHAGAEPG